MTISVSLTGCRRRRGGTHGIPLGPKDVWLTEALRRMAAIADAERFTLLFKGGTSLSKAYELIERFSKDVDVLVALFVNPERSFDGLGRVTFLRNPPLPGETGGVYDPDEEAEGGPAPSILRRFNSAKSSERIWERYCISFSRV